MDVVHAWPGMAAWAASNDPVLTRYAVGALARLVTADGPAAAEVAEASGLRALRALTTALGSADGQTQCYAAKAVGKRHCCSLKDC